MEQNEKTINQYILFEVVLLLSFVFSRVKTNDYKQFKTR